MKTLKIELEDGKLNYKAGEEIRGWVEWETDEDIKGVEVRLFWYTKGKGTEDIGIAETAKFENCGLIGEENFSFKAPVEPYSFSGKLISLVWAIETVAEPGGECERVEIVISGTGEEVMLSKSQAEEEGFL